MNGNMQVLVKNAFVTKANGLGITFLDPKAVDTPKFKGRGDFTCFYEERKIIEKLTPNIFNLNTVLEAEYIFEDSFGGTGRKKITKLYVPSDDGEVQVIDLLV